MSRTCFLKKEVSKYLIKNRKQETSLLVRALLNPIEGLSLPRATGSGAHWLSGQPQVTSNWLPTHRGRGRRQEEQSSKVSERPTVQRDRRGGRCWGQNERKRRRSSSHRTYVSLYTEQHPPSDKLTERLKKKLLLRDRNIPAPPSPDFSPISALGLGYHGQGSGQTRAAGP